MGVGGVVVPGFTFIAVAIVLAFGGVQLFALGLIGEYSPHPRPLMGAPYLEDRETDAPQPPMTCLMPSTNLTCGSTSLGQHHFGFQ